MKYSLTQVEEERALEFIKDCNRRYKNIPEYTKFDPVRYRFLADRASGIGVKIEILNTFTGEIKDITQYDCW